MANRLRVTELDFDQIKNNLKTFLKQQSRFQDYDFEGAGLNILLDLLAYNTHYNAYYLNMVANESFLDTAILRDSVVSHAKMLNYVPFSYTSPKAIINVTIDSGTTTPEEVTIPKGYIFLSNPIDGTSHSFVTLDQYTATKSGTSFFFENVDVYEGQLVTFNYTYTEIDNPKGIFIINDSNIDTESISITVQPNSSNTASSIYSRVEEILDVTSESEVFFLQEGRNGNYEVYFGDGVVGKKLPDGSIVSIQYLITKGDIANGADAFIGSQLIGTYSDFTIDVTDVAAGGAINESVDSIKFSAAAQYATQNRLVTVKDYESYIKSKYPSVDSLSVWGGEDNIPKVFGKVYIALKPKTNYFISETEKQRIIDEIISPKAIVSVEAEIRDPQFLFILLENTVQYNAKKTALDEQTIKNNIKQAILLYKTTNLDKFNSTFIKSKLQETIDATNGNSIVGSETNVKVQKRFKPKLNEPASYRIDFNVPLFRGTTLNRLTSTAFTVNDVTGISRVAFFEETPQSFTGISEVQVTNSGSGYITEPTVTISGDGTGATARAIIVNGKIQGIDIVNRGVDYTRAIITITGGSGFGAEAVAVIDGRTGTLRTIYFDSLAQRQIINSNVGTIDYDNGIVTINNINFLTIDSDDELIRITIQSDKGIIQSTRDTIVTIDADDPVSILTELEKQTNV
jgi:hypothetical protein